MDVLFLTLMVAGPAAGYVWAGRRTPGAGAGGRVLGAALGGAVPGLALWAVLAAHAPWGPADVNLLVYPVAFTVNGAALGLLGAGARALGAWRSGRRR